MSSVRLTQLSLVGGALIIIVLLLQASKVPSSDETIADRAVTARIDEAVVLVSGENPMQGIQLLRQLEQEYPDNIKVQWQMAEFSVMSGQLEKAVERYQKIIALDNDNKWSVAHFRLGEVFARMGNKNDAIASIETFLTRSNNDEQKKQAQQILNELKN